MNTKVGYPTTQIGDSFVILSEVKDLNVAKVNILRYAQDDRQNNLFFIDATEI